MSRGLEIPAEPGTYLLLLRLGMPAELCIGRLGARPFAPGLYGYTGSARGPGGLAARLRRYGANRKRPHWHIDYLLLHAEIAGALAARSRARLECVWAKWAADLACRSVGGFGASDCPCHSHLFFFESPKNRRRLIGRARIDLQAFYIPAKAIAGC